MTKIATIARNPVNSPNMTANDAAILKCIAAELTKLGAEVVSMSEDEEIPAGTQAICTMSRTAGTIERLREAEVQGIAVTNSATAVENCGRKRFMEILHINAIPQPRFHIAGCADDLLHGCFPCWIKKAEGWSCHRDDVIFAQTMQEAVAAIEQMAERGITEYIQMQHCPGDIIKFYGIGNDFFHHCYPGSGKFGKEEVNGSPKHYSFDTLALKEIAQKAAQTIGVEIFGGDAIITQDGKIFIIDMNDFPSFTPVRDTAAREIATLIINKTK